MSDVRSMGPIGSAAIAATKQPPALDERQLRTLTEGKVPRSDLDVARATLSFIRSDGGKALMKHNFEHGENLLPRMARGARAMGGGIAAAGDIAKDTGNKAWSTVSELFAAKPKASSKAG